MGTAAGSRSLDIFPSNVVFSGLVDGPQATVVTVKIQYDGKIGKDITLKDQIVVRTETENLEIPIESTAPNPDIHIEGDLDFGVVPHEGSVRQEIKLINNGEKAGSFQIDFDEGLPLKVNPRSGTVPARGTGKNVVTVVADLNGQDIGPVNGEATLHLEGKKDPTRITVGASVMKHTMQVIDQHGAQVEGVEFGTLFDGEQADQVVQIVNNGPKEIRCNVSFGSKFDMSEDDPPDDSKSDVPSEDSENVVDPFAGFIQTARMKAKAREAGENPYTIFPLTATIAPFKTEALKIRFRPNGHKPTKGFTSNIDAMVGQGKTYSYIAEVDFGVGGEKCRFPLRGRGIESSAYLHPGVLQFGEVPTFEHANLTVDIANKKSDLPVKFSIPKVPPYFHCDPAEGMVPPGQIVMLMVRYFPKALGHHQHSIPINVFSMTGKLIRVLKLHVHGSALRLGARKPLIGGTDKLPEDFIKDPKFVDVEAVAEESSKFTRSKLWEGKENARHFEDIGNGTRDALSMDDHKKKTVHQDKYTTFIRQKRAAKENLHLTRKETEDDINLGMDPRSGLKSPEPRVIVKPEPLWTGSVKEEQEPRVLKAITQEQGQSIPLFKDRPESEEEKRMCNQALSGNDITKLGMGPKVVEFGKVSASSTNTRYFVVHNPLSQPIHIVLDIKSIPEFKYTRNTSQIIPGGSMGKFPIVLFSKEVMAVNRTVEYVLNGCQFMSFDVEANVDPVVVDLSSDELTFRFDLDNWEPHVDQVLIMDNPNPFPAHYEWQCDNATFGITPISGTVPPQSSLETVVRWTPAHDQAPGLHETKMNLVLHGGTENHKRVRLRAELPEVSVRFRDSVLDVGPVATGVPQTRIVQLKNTGTHEAAFRVIANDALRCTPGKGKVVPDEVFDLEVAFTCCTPGVFHTSLELELRNHQLIKLPINATSLVPKVEVQQGEFDFGAVHTGGSSRLPLNFTNTTVVPATLAIDLTAYPNFEIILPKDNWNHEEYEECPLKRASRDSDTFSVCSTRCSRRLSGMLPEEVHTLSEGYKYQVYLIPHGSLQFYLMFRPTEERIYNFSLPMCLNTNSFAAGVPMQRPVKAEGLKPRLVFSQTRIDFGTQIVQRSQQIKVPYSADVRVTNNDDMVIHFGLKCDTNDGAVFSVTPAEATLSPGDTVDIAVQFLPKDAESYEEVVPISLDGDEDAHMELQLMGVGQYPRLRFDRREVVLPAVRRLCWAVLNNITSHPNYGLLNSSVCPIVMSRAPLGRQIRTLITALLALHRLRKVPVNMRSDARFLIVNDGFDNLELRYRLPADDHHLPLSIDFPEGNLIGIAKEKLPVVVSFQAGTPMSFTANIDFLDAEGNRYSVPVTGTTDNSILSIQSFLQCNAGEVIWNNDTSAPVMMEECEYCLPEGDEVFGCSNPLENFARYLNATTTKGPFKNVQMEIIQSRGRLLYDIVEHLGGKKLQNKVTNLSGNKKEAAEQILGHYDWILTFLKSHGALLNMVKPELLLDFDDFQRIMQSRVAKATTLEDEDAIDHWKVIEDDFERASKQAWNVVFLQITKVFLLSRVTVKSFKECCALGDLPTTQESKLLGSNVYSLPESILLAWLTENLAKGLPECAFRVTSFDSDLRNGVVLYALLINHWPALSRYNHKLVKQPIRDQQFLNNAELIVRMIEDLNLPFPIRAANLLEPDAAEMVLFVLYLYHTLPQLIPRTVIDFTGKLGEHQIKSIELANPSKRELVYSTRLEGHSDFAVESSTVKVDPKSTANINITCTPTIAMPQEARLVLSSRRDSGAHGATLVFHLRSRVNVRSPLKQIKTEVALYDFQRFEFTVNNPFPTDCEFNIRLLHEPALPLTVGNQDKETKGDGKRQPLKKVNARGGTNQSLPTSPSNAAAKEKVFPDAFGVDKLKLRMKQNGSDKLKGSFLPFTMGTHYCTVIFEDKDYGQFCYELVGEVTLPAVFAEHRYTVSVDGPQCLDIALPYLNHQLENARRVFQDKHPLSKDKEQLALVKASREDRSGEKSIAFQVSQSNSLAKTSEALALKMNGFPSIAESGNGPKRTMSNNIGGLVEANKPEQPNHLRLVLKPIGTGIYPCRVVLTSPNDVRVVDVEINAQKLGETFQLDFKCPAFQSINQDIPLVNNSEKSMVVHASCTGQHFTGPREVSVAPGSTGSYPLKFTAPWIGDYTGTLELTIPNTQEKNVYTLQGKSEDPQGEAHIVVECQARTSATKRVNVPNSSSKPVEFKVYSDLEFISGRDSIKVEGNTKANYKLTVNPPRSGVFHGTITFETQKGFYVWFSVEVRATEPPELGIIKVASQVRSAVSVAVSVTNPLPKNVQFVAKYSDDSLMGPCKLDLGPEETADFIFYYAPLVPGDRNGSVSLVSDEVGEFWYQLEMQAAEAAPLALPSLSAEVGKSALHEIHFENPIGREITVSVSSSNSRNFGVSPSQLSLGPYETGTIAVEYVPSSIGTTEASTIAVRNSEIGCWEYACRGQGLRPTVFPNTRISTGLGSSNSALISWRNPFEQPACVNVQLKTEDGSEVLSLLLRKTKDVSVPPFSSIQIPVGFSPQSLDRFDGELIVSGNFGEYRTLEWRYPVVAVAEAESKGAVYKFKCRARSELNDTFQLELAGLGQLTGKEEFTHEVIFSEEHRSSLENSLEITALETKISKPDQPLSYTIKFAPKKMFTAEVEFIVYKSTGGRWRFLLEVQSTEPLSDGVLVLEAHMDQTVAVPVWVHSSSEKPEAFVAAFTSDTPLQFDVIPPKGMLPPRFFEGKDDFDAPLYVSYCCKDLGKTLKGRLFVQTKDMQYSFDVEGRQPHYTPPDKKMLVSHLDNKLDPLLQSKLLETKGRKTNFVLSNLRKSQKWKR